MILFFKGNIKIFESDIYANRNLNDLSVLKHANKGLITGLWDLSLSLVFQNHYIRNGNGFLDNALDIVSYVDE